MNYCDINKNKEHVTALIKWLIEEVMSSGGDGDGIWYSRTYSVAAIKELIETGKLVPKFWRLEQDSADSFSIGDGQEWLFITNNESHFTSRPDWQQVALVY